MKLLEYKVGDTQPFHGCFTHEEWLVGKNPLQMAWEIGLRPERVAMGVYIVWAKILPKKNEFDLGGYAKFSTDNFATYKDGKSLWSEKAFEETYKDGKRMNISIYDAKKAWLKEMKRSKLVKVVPVIAHTQGEVYPPGNKAPQIIVNSGIQCLVVKLLTGSNTFRGVWGSF